MNIFVLDERPHFAAMYHNDRHVVKMILETAQLLCTAHVMLDGDWIAKRRIGEMVLRPSHVHHPCAIWARTCQLNYDWLLGLGRALCTQYGARFGKPHSFGPLYIALEKFPVRIEHLAMRTPWPQCMPERYKGPDAVEAYRSYYFFEKKHIAKWSPPVGVPNWWRDMETGGNRQRAAT